ncbi:LysR family transcriptional regulator [Isoalcanivorax pacificus W11-5]|uniref:LysR family transcriptional regulator n=1 Tax=Isoalcanivorax pacificus W11-5 TaxID=391936 RepID=A0A0B4XT11_9GAMM|nr:LysR family transcriptional regulator [Isoalcanivorax pacificus]AJD49437.1 LysR family transcriptional regulator [Isoalcanivorax pacificus W11-5]
MSGHDAPQSAELRLFVAVVECGTISAAAEQLGVAPSVVSRTLSRLERKLGTTLLSRTTRRMELTEEGRFALERARVILDQMDALEDSLASRREQPVGRLRVDAATPFMLHALVPHVPAFRRLYPQISLQLNTSDQIIDLLEQRTDIAIRIGRLADSTLHARSLGMTPLRLLASPDYLARAGTPRSVAELPRHSLLGFSRPESLNTWPVRQPDGGGLVITPTLSASSGETLRALALAGEGIACLSGFMTDADLAAGALVPVLPNAMKGAAQEINAVYYRHSQLALRIRCFLDFMQQKCGTASA